MIAVEGGSQIVVGRFMYGPLDMVALTGEKVFYTIFWGGILILNHFK